MKKQPLVRISMLASVLLCGCQSMENLLTDSGMREQSQQDVVVNPVPRTQVPQAQEGASATAQQAPSKASSEPQPQAAAKTPAQTQNNHTQSVIPNVAPSLGE